MASASAAATASSADVTATEASPPPSTSPPPTSAPRKKVHTAGALLAAVAVAVVAAAYQLELPDHKVVLVRKSAEIATTQSELFRYISDLNNYAEWFTSVHNMTSERPGPPAIGKRYVHTEPIFSIGDMKYQVMITAIETPRHVAFNYLGWLKLTVDITLDKRSDKKCFLTWQISTTRNSYLFYGTIGSWLRMMYGFRARHALFALALGV